MLSRKMGGANPCDGWCLNPMIAMIAAIGVSTESIVVESTLMVADHCKVIVYLSPYQQD